MRAAWYERQGPATDVLHVGELPLSEPAAGEVRVRLQFSGVNPGDVGGTAAEATVVPDALAVDLPETVSAELGATLGIAGITSHRAVFTDGPVAGQTMLVHGARCAAGSLAAQLAHQASVIGTVRHSVKAATVPGGVVSHLVALDGPNPVARIREIAPDGVNRIVEVALSANADPDAEVAQGAVIAAYSSPADRPMLPFWPLLFTNVSLRLLGSDDFPAEAKQQATRDITQAAAANQLFVPIALPYSLNDIVEAHHAVESRNRTGRILVRTS